MLMLYGTFMQRLPTRATVFVHAHGVPVIAACSRASDWTAGRCCAGIDGSYINDGGVGGRPLQDSRVFVLADAD